jgi:hypothetical protein
VIRSISGAFKDVATAGSQIRQLQLVHRGGNHASSSPSYRLCMIRQSMQGTGELTSKIESSKPEREGGWVFSPENMSHWGGKSIYLGITCSPIIQKSRVGVIRCETSSLCPRTRAAELGSDVTRANSCQRYGCNQLHRPGILRIFPVLSPNNFCDRSASFEVLVRAVRHFLYMYCTLDSRVSSIWCSGLFQRLLICRISTL